MTAVAPPVTKLLRPRTFPATPLIAPTAAQIARITNFFVDLFIETSPLLGLHHGRLCERNNSVQKRFLTQMCARFSPSRSREWRGC